MCDLYMAYLAVVFALDIWVVDIFPIERAQLGFVLITFVTITFFLQYIMWLFTVFFFGGCFSMFAGTSFYMVEWGSIRSLFSSCHIG